MVFAVVIILLIIFILLVLLDFKMGRMNHQRHPRVLPSKKTTGNYELFQNGPPFYERLFQDISNAQKQVDICFYIIDNDYISENFLQILKEKAREGILVRLLLDRVGGYRVNKRMRKELQAAGVEFQFAEVPEFPYFFYKLNRRNHRKITVIDGNIGYAGGFNIGKNYIGETPKFGNWRDYHLRLTGPAVKAFHEIFLDDWYLATGNRFPALANEEEGQSKLKIVATDGVELEKEFDQMIQFAKEEILIGTPYFIPTPKLMASLHRALEKEVTLKILVPMKADHPFVKEAAIPYLHELYKHGANIRFFDAGFYHSKLFMIDKQFADIGTANFDRRSFFLNKEVNTFVYEEKFLKELRKAYLKDFDDAMPFNETWLNNRSLSTKINEKIAALLRPLL
ncbi:cardiolipin synthase [Halobacillus mangrovi]|uniref:cardiolipin synthase n=1 Tax=Halobacillus mangrovi TaxID=402384 RepID=UPI003D99F99D